MGHKCSYVCRFEIDVVKNDVVVITTASYKNYSLDVYKEYLKEDKAYCRNLWFSYLAGYTVNFPDEKVYKNRYCKERYGLESWGTTEKIETLRCGKYYQELWKVKTLLEATYPELKYFVKKFDDSSQYYRLFEIIRNYWKHPESETLIQMGLFDLALNQSLYKLTKPKLKEVIRTISSCDLPISNLKLKDIQTYNKNYKDQMTFKEFIRWYIVANERMARWVKTLTFEEYKYIEKQAMKSNGKIQISNHEYFDYLEMAKKVGHDITDPYWKYPSDFRKKHDEVMEQIRTISASKLALQQDFLKIVCKSMVKYNKTINGYKIFIPLEAIEWQTTCDELYQCLIRNGYMKKVINQETIIVFIWKDNKPIATAEIDYKKKIQQFYGDERGHQRGESCKPSEEVETVFNEWLKTFKPKKEKFVYEDNIHYYKGFDSFDGNIFHTNVGSMDGVGKGSSFKVGEIYLTPFEDEEIETAGGQGCVSTNKVFHFCNSITEISRHYNPKVYCEIKPLGAVVEHDGAILSNKIEIIRPIPEEEVKALMILEQQSNQAMACIS